MPRAALKFGYLGREFAGYAHQNINSPPNTVEYCLLKALRIVLDREDMGLMELHKETKFKSGSRTDKGVSALGNVICFKSGISAEKAAIDDQVPEVVKLFCGEHDFGRFSKADPARPELGTVRELTHAGALREDGLIKLDFTARGYLWQMIRRIVWAIDRNLMGKMSLDEIKEALNGGGKERAGGGSLFTGGVAPPEPLVLMDVAYDKVEFNIMPKKKEKLTAQLWV